MVKRKIIKFGNSSYVLTLPNQWLKKNDLGKGDELNVSLSKNSLLVFLKDKSRRDEIEIKIDDLPLKLFNKKLISYYLKNVKRIKISGKNVIERLEEIRIFKEKLSSIEIYEIGKDFILLKDLSEPKKLNVNNLISKMINIIKILFDEIVLENRHSFIAQLDSNVNKLTFLTYKTINYNLEINQDLEITKNAIYLWRIVDSIEAIGDILKRVERYMNLHKKNIDSVRVLINSLKIYYEFVTDLLSTQVNIDNNMKLYLDKKQSLLREFENFKESQVENQNVYLVLTQMLKDVIGKLDIIMLSIIDINSW